MQKEIQLGGASTRIAATLPAPSIDHDAQLQRPRFAVSRAASATTVGRDLGPVLFIGDSPSLLLETRETSVRVERFKGRGPGCRHPQDPEAQRVERRCESQLCGEGFDRTGGFQLLAATGRDQERALPQFHEHRTHAQWSAEPQVGVGPALPPGERGIGGSLAIDDGGSALERESGEAREHLASASRSVRFARAAWKHRQPHQQCTEEKSSSKARRI